MTSHSTAECSRCGRELLPSSPAELRLCANCVANQDIFPAHDLLSYSEQELDRLPFGVIEIDREGKILAYNAAEEKLSHQSREEVMGRDFFTDVAPCTNVREFAGVYRDMVQRGVAAERGLDFVFRFEHGTALVHVQLIYSAVAKAGIVLVKRHG